VLAVNKFEYEYDMSFLYGEPDPSEWEMKAYDINAYFHPLKNEIVFPAGILQEPFFSLKLSLPQIYGGIGAIIGHEITHGFDDQGKKFDGDGNMKQWWTKKDEIKYAENAKKIIDQFNKFKIRGISVNGKLTQGENIADLGGLVISYDALKLHMKKVSDNDTKNFFESWASNWKCKISKKEQNKRLLTDPHSPNYFRVNGPLVNIDKFHEVYKTESGDSMYKEPNERIKIW
jgi:putative endopeptidase